MKTIQELPKPIEKKSKTTEEIGSRIFDFFDKDKKGFLNQKEIRALLEQTFRHHNVSEQHYKDTIKQLDVNSDGNLSKKNYIALLKRIMDKSFTPSN